ncbi:P-loop containing nucleoside triphosphate hydrolase protein, partial [Ilyonectria destructans]
MLHTPLCCPDPESLPSTLATLLNFPPRDGQVEAIRRLAVDQQDLILIAPTGWGKSAVFQAIPALRGGICLMIMPLNLLEEGQAKSIARIPNCRPCVLNGQSNKAALLNEIRIGKYTHVLLSPEIALSERFKTEVLYDQAFQDHLVLVAIDELHVVSEWGLRWRSSYSGLALLRDLISRSVPWLGCSATLDPVTLAEVRDLSGFDPSVRIQRTSIDRPNITFEIQAIQYRMDGFRDLEFLVKPVQAAIEKAVKERRESMAREAFKSGGTAAAQALFT